MNENALQVRATSDELAPTQLSSAQLTYIANTEFVPKDYRGQMPKILACVAVGRALELPDMIALNTIYMVDGKVGYSAEMMSAIAMKRGHMIEGEADDEKATVVGTRGDTGKSVPVTFTIEQAKRAGLVKPGSAWEKYPEDMLWARAVSRLCRRLFADCFAGATYSEEEVDSLELDAPPDADGGREIPLSPASVSDADSLIRWAGEHGITEAQVKARKYAMFPDSKNWALTDDEIRALYFDIERTLA